MSRAGGAYVLLTGLQVSCSIRRGDPTCLRGVRAQPHRGGPRLLDWHQF